MGGLIAGAFATGIPAPDIRRLTSETDWDAVLSTDAPFEDATFRRKQDRRAFPAGLEFGVRRALWLPRSLNPGQRIALLLDSFTLPYSALPAFDDLPTPFRCVAFDINKSESVVLDRGVLSEAMRATMATAGDLPAGDDRGAAAGGRRVPRQRAGRGRSADGRGRRDCGGRHAEPGRRRPR